MKSHKGYAQTSYGKRKKTTRGSAPNSTSTGLRVDHEGLRMALESQQAQERAFVKDAEETYPLGGRAER